MERKDIVTIGEVLRECLEKSSMQDKLDEVRACDAFPLVVGRQIAAKCGRPSMRNAIMTVSISNSPLRSELNMSRGSISKAINEICGKDIVKEILFR